MTISRFGSGFSQITLTVREKRKSRSGPDGDASSLVDHSVCLGIPVGDEEMKEDVDEEDGLGGDVEKS